MQGECKPVWGHRMVLAGTMVAWSLAGLLPALAQDSEGYFGRHMWGGWDGGWWMFIGPVWLILFLAVIVGVVVLLVRGLSGGGGSAGNSGAGAPASKTPLDILRERFARGEIDKEEFEERRRILGA